MKRRVSPKTGLLVVCLAVAASTGVVSLRRVADQLAVLEACDAVARSDWTAALAGTQGRTGAGATGRAAAECRCTALLARDRGAECANLLESLLAQPDDDGWVPGPQLSVHLIQTWRDAGRSLEAAELARHAAAAHPADADLFYLELVTRSAVEDEASVLTQLRSRVPAGGPAAVRMRVSLANRHLLRGDAERALEVLGDAPPPGAGVALGLWFETRGIAQANAGDLAGLKRSYESWRSAGGDPAELRARYALTLSIGKLRDPEHPTRELLERALEQDLDDARLEEALLIRLILSLAVDGRSDEAMARYEAGRQRFALEGLSREELERSAVHRALRETPPRERSGKLRFSVAGPESGWRLWVSPQPDAPVDAGYEQLSVPPSGQLVVERRLGEAPQRWVLRDRDGTILASGTVDPRPGETREVSVTRREASAPGSATLTRRPGDGRRRVAVLLLDCADWRIVQYLRARGELPVLSRLIETGYRGVLHSDPPLTAAALEALVWPRRSADPSFVGLLHRFGVELAGLASVGENPLSALSWVLPEAPDLFAVVGAGERSAANLLFSHGGIHSGRHGMVTGPAGRTRSVPVASSARDLDAAEGLRFPALSGLERERDAVHVRTIAAELDAAESLVRGKEIDLLMLRIEPLDILTHAHFAEAVRDGQDDGAGILFSVYRYIDARLGSVHDLLDADDVFVVMSDHGIRTAMEHSRHAIFVAAGAGVPHGRAPGEPELRGVSRALADLLGVATAWPDTGVAPWARDVASLASPGPKPHPGPTR